ncbi:MAG: hypothetical protein GY769_17650 [bacterium]|nr:hypothetical protein [bacterium]
MKKGTHRERMAARRASHHTHNLRKHGVCCGVCYGVYMPLNIRRHMLSCDGINRDWFTRNKKEAGS